jgi:hypothetical protein
MLLTSAWRRLLAAGVALALLWTAVLWVAPSAPSIALDRPAERVPIQLTTTPVPAPAGWRTIAWSGLAAPGGGRFDRFDSASHPIVAPVNARGQVAFYATVLHAFGREGLYIADSEHVTKVATFGDSIPGGGSLAEFGTHPLPALNNAGHVAFTAGVAGGRATEGIFLTSTEGLRVIALSGDDAPGIPAGILVGFNEPALNDNDELAFVANVRRGRDTLDVLYFWNGTRLQRVIAEGDRLLRIGGTMDKIGEPALNNSGVIAFPAAIFKGPALGGIFVAGSRDLRLLVSAGDRIPSGAMILRFSERVAIDDEDAIAFSSYLGNDGNTREAVLVNKADGLVEVAVEGASAPGGGRYAAFGPWPTIGTGGVISFIAALDGAPEPLAVFVGKPDNISPVILIDKTSPRGDLVGHLTLNTVPSVGPDGAVTFATVAQESAGGNAIYCRCPPLSR